MPQTSHGRGQPQKLLRCLGVAGRVELAKQLVAAGLECSFDTSSGGGVLKCCGGKVLVQKVNRRAQQPDATCPALCGPLC